MPDDRLRDDEVARVLRRAAELDGPASGGGHADEGMPVAALEAAAAEVGLSPAAVRQAVAELRTGALDAVEADAGPSLVVCARLVPGTCDDCVDGVGRYLSRQALVRARDRGAEQVWRPREDWFARMQRRFDWAAAIRLGAVDEVVVRAIAVEGGTLVRVVARLERAVVAAPRIGGGVGAGVGALGMAFVGAAVGDPAVGIIGAPIAAAGGGTIGWRLGRRSRANQHRRVTDSIEGALDELELGRPLVPGRTPFDRLAVRARRLRGGYRV